MIMIVCMCLPGCVKSSCKQSSGRWEEFSVGFSLLNSNMAVIISLQGPVAMLLLRYFTDMFDRYSIFEVSIQPDLCISYHRTQYCKYKGQIFNFRNRCINSHTSKNIYIWIDIICFISGYLALHLFPWSQTSWLQSGLDRLASWWGECWQL